MYETVRKWRRNKMFKQLLEEQAAAARKFAQGSGDADLPPALSEAVQEHPSEHMDKQIELLIKEAQQLQNQLDLLDSTNYNAALVSNMLSRQSEATGK